MELFLVKGPNSCWLALVVQAKQGNAFVDLFALNYGGSVPGILKK